MLRALAAAFLLTVLVQPVSAVSPTFGAAGSPIWDETHAPDGLAGADGAGEPTIGIPWETGHIFYIAHSDVYRIEVNETGNATWTHTPTGNPIEDVQSNLDPMLHADPVTGRVWAGGLYLPCSSMSYSDDDGATWAPTTNMCGVYGVDHQTIGSGPWVAGLPPGDALYERAVYYCAHGEALSVGIPVFFAASPTACITSPDGGATWGPPVPWTGGCGSLHGHVKVGPTGSAAVPDADCAIVGGPDSPGFTERAGFAYSNDNGATWTSRTVAGSEASAGFNNPALDFTLNSGWLYYGQANAAGAFVALSKDDGLSWETLGTGMEVNETTWLDVGQFHDPPVRVATFAKVVAGDDDRVAFSFMGIEELPGGKDLPNAFQCTEDQDEIVWHYYVAMSYDAGQTWRVQRVSEDPVQIGGVWQGQVPPGEDNWCRNLLDFNDMDINAEGRLYLGYADGCIEDCIKEGVNGTDGWRSSYATLVRQVSGNGLLSAYDIAPPGDVRNETIEPTPAPTEEPANEDSPGLPFVALAAVIALAVVLRRRK